MRCVLIRALALATLSTGPALAQNSDVGLLVGGLLRTSGSVSPGRVAGAVSAAGQINYALQLHEARAGRLYLELPVLIAARTSGIVAPGSITASDTTTVFFTPGVRWHYTVTPRVALYGAIGGGIASLSGNYAFIGNGIVDARSGRTTTGAFGFGGGIDFRLTRLMSLRAEGRDFITRAGLGGERGRNHAFVTVGVGFHF